MSGVSARRRTANRLGALALAIADDMDAAVRETLGQHGTDAAALVVIDTHPRGTIRDLASVLGLTHSGGVRLVDRLVTAGWVKRERADDPRASALRITAAGERRRAALTRHRTDVVAMLLDALDDREVERLERAVSTLLASRADSIVRACAICRLCDTATCVPYGCPVEAGLEHASS